MAIAYYQGSDGEYYKWTPQMIGSESGSNGLVQSAGIELPDGKSIVDYVPTCQSFAGTVMTNDQTWYNLLSIRHRNNRSDGIYYGMILYALLTDPTGNLAWRQQYGSEARPGKGWGNERIIVDSQNPEIVVSSSQPTNPNAKVWVQI